MTSSDRWERAAARETARRQKDAGPLFAPLVAPVTPDAQEERMARLDRAWRERATLIDADLRHRGDVMRETVRAALTVEDFEALEAFCERAFPMEDPGMRADVWRDECRKRGLPEHVDPVWEATMARVRELEAAQAERRAAAGDQIPLDLEEPR